jgi:hypothetical protein
MAGGKGRKRATGFITGNSFEFTRSARVPVDTGWLLFQRWLHLDGENSPLYRGRGTILTRDVQRDEVELQPYLERDLWSPAAVVAGRRGVQAVR